MQAEYIDLLTSVIQFANLSDPSPDHGVTRLEVNIGNFNARHYAVAVLQALGQGGLRITKDEPDA